MKKVLIGGFLSLIGTIWGAAVIIFVSNNDLASSWFTLIGPFFTTAVELGMVVPMIMSLVLLLIGLWIMSIEYFKKDN